MTTLTNRPNTAVAIIDKQRGVVARAYDVERVVANINVVIERARAAAVPVIWVQHSDEELTEGSAQWEYVPELRRLEGEPLVAKNFGDAFEATDLESVLAEHKVGRLGERPRDTRAQAGSSRLRTSASPDRLRCRGDRSRRRDQLVPRWALLLPASATRHAKTAGKPAVLQCRGDRI